MASCASFQTPAGEKYDVAIEGTVFKVMDAASAGSVDAIERETPERGPLVAVVSFKLNQVLNGELPKVKAGGASKLEQLTGAAKTNNFLKVLTMDVQDPEELIERKWFRVAVGRPSETFGVSSWENPEPRKFKIYLKEITERPGSYEMLQAIPA